MKIKTRDRILNTSLELFNTVGEPNVTTLLISDELDISPGNLYYHFKSKAEIVNELFAAYEAELLEMLSVPEEADISLDDQALFLHLVFEAIARYRFIYQDLVNILTRYDNLQNRFRRILRAKEKAFIVIAESLQRQGLMQLADHELSALCEQMCLTMTYWVSFESLSHLDNRDQTDLGRGVFQVMTLLAPYLNGAARQQVIAMSEAYL